ncbi:14184_t:CDS:2, partial [Funneliformis geosporum]
QITFLTMVVSGEESSMQTSNFKTNTVFVLSIPAELSMQVIYTGDLNAEPRRHINPKHSNQFFRNLANCNLFNLGDICYDDANTRHPTFHRNGCNPSRIDHIYCSTELATQTIGLTSTPTDLSDHYLL